MIAALAGAALALLACCGTRRAPGVSSAPPPATSAAPPAVASPPPVAEVPYGRRIALASDAAPALRAAAEDAAGILARVTGESFSVGPEGPGTAAIRLVSTASKDAPPMDVARLSKAGPEAFAIHSSDAKELFIVANTSAGLVHGLYHYLREIGCRFLMPADEWTILPVRRDVAVRLDRVVSPAFKMRNFFGTGGFGPPLPVDPKQSLRDRWSVFMRRNGFGGEILVGGHAGEAFASAHRAELEAHPEYRALRGDERADWSPSVALCVSNPGLVALYVKDRLDTLRRVLAADASAPQAFAVTVEPADAAAHCDCKRCQSIGRGTESDQVFHLANEVAKAVAKEFPGRYASVLAYSQHAAPPAIPLEKNVYVTVVPDAFQRTGLRSDQLIQAWRERVPRISVSTYWSPPDWAKDLPVFDWLAGPAQQIRTLRDLGVEGLTLETSYGGGAMGLGLYVASRLLFNPDEDERVLADETLQVAFGPAVAPMRRLLVRWARQFTPTSYELGLSYRDLREARQKAAKDPAVLRRVRDYELYLEYLRRFVEYQSSPQGSDEQRALARATLVWLYRIYDSGMVASFRMHQLMVNRFLRDPGLRAEFDFQVPTAPGWAEAKRAISDDELATLVAEAARRYPPSTVEARTYSSRLVTQSNRASLGADPANPPLYLVGPTDLVMDVPSADASEIELTVKIFPGASFDEVTVLSAEGATVVRELVPVDGGPHTLRVWGGTPGRYRVHIEDQRNGFVLKLPKGVPHALSRLVSWNLSPRVYFWVPRGHKRIALYAPSVYPVDLFDADGRRVEAPKSGFLEAPVPEGQDGRAWSIGNYKASEQLRLLNVPTVLSLSPDALLVPEDALN